MGGDRPGAKHDEEGSPILTSILGPLQRQALSIIPEQNHDQYMTDHQLQATRKERVLNEDEDDPEGSWEKQKGPQNQKTSCIRSSASINKGGVGGVSESSFGSHYRRPSSVDLI
ncbi:hypothetical protein PGT21_022167 [Puccinia graminis f. sp. tritici]|uniref:Uncharacterized protein n=1 Tax=Puccinia graminis f. sp. tritici TaxID=56615 RepID=A0A5B0QG23_PUCGR|nr:hypothetical protein PGT21_022167 [Puccinia graminis f. sp. tritici]